MKRIVNMFILPLLALTFIQDSNARIPLFRKPALVFKLGNHCSATMIRYKEKCHLFTNNHCSGNKNTLKLFFSNLSDLDNIFDGVSSMFATIDSPPLNTGVNDVNGVEVEVVKRAGRLDLAELSWQSDKLHALCAELDEVAVEDYYQAILPSGVITMKSFAAVGYSKSSPLVKYSGNIGWYHGRRGASQVVYNYYLENDLYHLFLSDLETVPGMSGGAVVNGQGKLIGISTGHIDLQSNAFIVPVPMILKFIGDELLGQTPETHIDNDLKSTGDNEHGGLTAGGSHAFDNGYGNNPIDRFQGPDEGIRINRGSRLVTLGFVSRARDQDLKVRKHFHQIDGINDYRLKVKSPIHLATVAPSHQITKFITREKDGFPVKKLRREILSRLHGRYYLTDPGSFIFSTEGGAPTFNSRAYLYSRDIDLALGFNKLLTGYPDLAVDVDSGNKTLTLEISPFTLARPRQILGKMQVPKTKHVYDIKFANNHKMFFLYHQQTGKQAFSCTNRHLLKILCQGGDKIFYLSVNNTTTHRIAKVRLAIQVAPTLNHDQLYLYVFSTLMVERN